MTTMTDPREIIDYVCRYGGRCHDCADADMICPDKGLPCDVDVAAKTIKHVLDALQYGIENNFIPNPIQADAIRSARAEVYEECARIAESSHVAATAPIDMYSAIKGVVAFRIRSRTQGEK